MNKFYLTTTESIFLTTVLLRASLFHQQEVFMSQLNPVTIALIVKFAINKNQHFQQKFVLFN